MYRKFSSLFLFSLLNATALFSQDKAYAKQVIDTLASPSMHGRGYVAKGDKIAAKYISDQYKSFGLLSFNAAGNYFQNFSFPINTFPGKVSMTFYWENGKKETCDPGQHFLVNSDCPSVKGHFNVVKLDSSVVNDNSRFENFKKLNFKKSFVLVDTSGVRNKSLLTYMVNFEKYPLNVKGILIPVKPTGMTESCSRLSPWDFSMMQSTVCVIEIESEYKSVVAIDINIGAKFIKNYASQNVIAYIKGKENPDSFIVFTAHYDHLGQMGKTVFFPGANDNASGVAMLLSLARYYSKPEHQPKCSIAFMAFGGEEVALLGSAFYVKNPYFPLAKIKFLTNMDILGTGDEGITVVNATLFTPEYKTLEKLNANGNYLAAVKARGKAAISDHHFFTEAGVRCFYIYTLGGIKAYHDTCDRRETLPLTKFEELFSLLRDFTDWEDSV